MTDFARLISTLASGQVRFILVGGVAAVAHGAARLTQDVDVVYDRRKDNLELLATALVPIDPYLRGAPAGLPFVWDIRTLERGLNFTLTTTAGDLDLLGEIPGGGGYDELIGQSQTIALFGVPCAVLSLEGLITVKRAAGRPKDFEALAELEALLEERG